MNIQTVIIFMNSINIYFSLLMLKYCKNVIKKNPILKTPKIKTSHLPIHIVSIET